MIEYKSNEEIDHGSVGKGDWRRRKRISTAIIKNALDKLENHVSGHTIVGDLRKTIPKELLTKANIPRVPLRSYPKPDLPYHREPFKPGYGHGYWAKEEDTPSHFKWTSSSADYKRYDEKNCYRTQEEAQSHEIKRKEPVFRRFDPRIT